MHELFYQRLYLVRDFHNSPFWSEGLSYASPVVSGRRYRVLQKGTKLSIQRLWGDMFELQFFPNYQQYLIAEGSMDCSEGHAHIRLTIRACDLVLFVSYVMLAFGMALMVFSLFENWRLSVFIMCFTAIGIFYQRWLIRRALQLFLKNLEHDMERF